MAHDNAKHMIVWNKPYLDGVYGCGVCRKPLHTSSRFAEDILVIDHTTASKWVCGECAEYAKLLPGAHLDGKQIVVYHDSGMTGIGCCDVAILWSSGGIVTPVRPVKLP